MSAPRYFAYGSNLDAEQMRERCPSAEPLFRARLLEHRLAFTYFSTRWSGGAADVIAAPGALVWGVVYALNALDFERLDHFEAGYTRIALEVVDDHDRCHSVTSYSVREKSAHAPNALYVEKITRWGAYWNFPESYLAALSSTPAPLHPR